MFSKQNITYFLMALIIIWAFGYMAYGNDTPTREEMKQNKIEQLKETNARIEMNNKIAESVCEEESLDKWGAIEIAKYKLSCLEKDIDALIDIDSEIEKEFGTGSVVVWTSTASTVAVHSWIKTDRTEELERLNKEVCKKNINSPICDRETFYRLYKITEERLPWKNFFPILLGITNAESSLGTAYAKNNKGWYCTGYNNLGWIKYRKTDDGKSVRDQKIPDANGCYLYRFDSIDDYWISKVNTIRYGYKGCVNSTTPIKCMSYAYVGDRNVSEASWVRNVSIFLP